jgi:hypothetical protein
MLYFPRSIFFLVLFLIFPFAATAAPLCEYAGYSVPALHQNIVRALGERGFAVAPATYFSDSAAETERLNEDLWVLKDGNLYAILNYSQNAVEASSELRIKDPNGSFLAEARSRVSPCNRGWCRETRLKTARDNLSSWNWNQGDIEIRQVPSYGMQYLVYGDPVGGTSWRFQFDERFEWILAVLTNIDAAMPIQSSTSLQRFIFALASEPAVIPFFNDIAVTVARDGHFIVRGRVTHAAYNGIVWAALNHGFYNVEPLLIIDSAAGAHHIYDQEIRYCLGRPNY